MARYDHLRQTHRRAIRAGITLSVAVHAVVLGLARFDTPDSLEKRAPTLVQLPPMEATRPVPPDPEAVPVRAPEFSGSDQVVVASETPAGGAILTANHEEPDGEASSDEVNARPLRLALSAAPLTPGLFLDEIATPAPPQPSATDTRGSAGLRNDDTGRRRGPAIRISIGGRGIGGPGCTVTGRGFGFPGRQIVRRF